MFVFVARQRPVMIQSLFPALHGCGPADEEVEQYAQRLKALKQAGAKFRNDIVTGNGGRQILLEDPAGNPIELFEPTRV